MATALAAAALSPNLPPSAAAASSAVLIGGLSSPAAFTVTGSGQVYFAELRSGVVQTWNPASRRVGDFFVIPGGAGRSTLGLALRDGYLYGYSARLAEGAERLQLWRVRAGGATGRGFQVLRTVGTRPHGHAGGPLRFGPDGMLYLSVGDQDDGANAQRRTNDFGKILRLTPTGGVPAGATSRIYAYGLRNSFGFDFDRPANRLWATDNGPDCNDEINLITRGGNYGWGPNATCATPPPAPANTNQDGPSPILPQRYQPTPVAPTGVVFASGRLLYGTFKTRQIRRATLTASRLGVASDTLVLTHGAPILAMQSGPGGRVYFADTGSIRLLG